MSVYQHPQPCTPARHPRYDSSKKAHQTQLAPAGEAGLSVSTADAVAAAERVPVEAVTVHILASCSKVVPGKGWTVLPAISAG